MEIQKIFSDQTGEERLYSVLLSEDELRLFTISDSEILKSLEVIKFEYSKKYPRNDVGLYITKTVSGSKDVIIAAYDIDSVHLSFEGSGKIYDWDSKKNIHPIEVIPRLIKGVDILLDDNLPRTKPQLEYLKKLLTTLG